MTAVEWLYDEIKHIIPNYFLNKFEQAKEMEKQHIIDAFEEGYGSGYRDNGKEGNEYYNETFKNKKL